MARPSRPLLIALLLSLAMLAAAGLYWRAQRSKLPEGLVQANGRIEGDHVLVSGKFAGKLARVLVREGDSVSAGQVLAELDPGDQSLQVNAARAELAAAEADPQSDLNASPDFRRHLAKVLVRRALEACAR